LHGKRRIPVFMSYDISTSPLQYGAAVASGLLFGAAVFAKRLRTPKSAAPPASRSELSLIGLVIQSASFFIAAFGRLRLGPALSVRSVILAAVVLALGCAGALLFDRSAKVLGANWSLVARMRTDHGLVREGPFARVRHPIYFAMLLMLFAVGLGLGHIVGLAVALPVFFAGTVIRTREEERLLRQQFGSEYDDYARTTPAFIPRIG